MSWRKLLKSGRISVPMLFTSTIATSTREFSTNVDLREQPATLTRRQVRFFCELYLFLQLKDKKIILLTFPYCSFLQFIPSRSD